MMDPNPNASTHKARFAAFEGATQLRNRFPTTRGRKFSALIMSRISNLLCTFVRLFP